MFLVTVGKCLRSILSNNQQVSATCLVQQWRMPAGEVYCVDSTVHLAGDGVLSMCVLWLIHC